MLSQLKKKLNCAEGRSEFVISVICDIRGFSSFSTCHESPDTAMFIKRFYLKLLNEYFTEAIFAKPTGDGMLLIFRYSEATLQKVSEHVLSACFKVIDDFPTMFKDDPMINFPTPVNVGFGISRGPSCCLFSGKTILDYSGQLLNLAARLNDIARPKGIVIAGSYLGHVIPNPLRCRFKTEKVYVRGIAEEAPIDIFYSQPEVTLPDYALHPINTYEWKCVTHKMTVGELQNFKNTFTITLPTEPLARDKTNFKLNAPHSTVPKYINWWDLTDYSYYKDASGYHLRFSLEEPKKIIKAENLAVGAPIEFEFQFVEKKVMKKKQ